MVPRIPVVACFCEMHVGGMSQLLLTASYQSKKCQVYGSRQYHVLLLESQWGGMFLI